MSVLPNCITVLEKLHKEHWAMLFLALLVASIVALPQVYFRFDPATEGLYQGIENFPDSPWSPRVREVQDGHPLLGSPYYKEGKDDPYLFQPFGTMVWGYLGKLFSLDINNTFLFSRFVLTFVASILIYSFVFLVSRNKLAALTSMVVILLADSVVSYSGMLKFLHGISPEDYLSIGKPVNNTMIYIPFFGFLVSMLLYYRTWFWRYGILSGVLLGINFYNYFYTWTFLYAFLGVLFTFLLMQKKWSEAGRVTAVGIGGVIVAIPYLLNLYQATMHPLYEVVSMRFGIVLSHAPHFVGVTVLAALFIFVVGFPRSDRKTYFFGLALLLAPFITMNQQLITGKVMQASHYHWYFHKPLALIFVSIVLFRLFSLELFAPYRRVCALALITFCVGVGLFIQIDSYHNSVVDGRGVLIERQKYGPIVDWLSQNAERDAVVFGNNEVSHLTVLYTPLDVFYHRSAYAAFSATEERLHDMLFTFYRLEGVSHDTVREVFTRERGHISANLYGVYYRDLFGSEEAIPDAIIEDMIVQYRETLSTPFTLWVSDMFMKYGVRYLVWDRKTDPDWHVEALPFLMEVARSGDVVIYEVSRDNIVLAE